MPSIMNNLQIFRQAVQNFVSSGSIDTFEELTQVAEHLCDNKLLTPKEVSSILKSKYAYPISLNQFQNSIVQLFGDPTLLEAIKKMQRTLRDVKGTLNVWSHEGITQEERKQLNKIIYAGNKKVQNLLIDLQNQKKDLENINQQQVQLINSLDQWVIMQKITPQFMDYKEYLAAIKKTGDALFNKIRVRQVHFKNKIKKKEYTKQGIKDIFMYLDTEIGYDSRTDQPVEVLMIPKKQITLQALDGILRTYNARRDLILSPYYPRFLGYSSNNQFYLYFSEWKEGFSLQELIDATKVELDQDSPLFKYWFYLLYQGLSNAYTMCSYQLQLPLNLKDCFVFNGGLNLHFNKCIFGGLRNKQNKQKMQSQDNIYQAKLLQCLGKLGRQLLKGQMPIKVQNKCLFGCLQNAIKMQKKNVQGKVNCLLTLFNIQTHPLFESKDQIDGEVIIDNYMAMIQ